MSNYQVTGNETEVQINTAERGLVWHRVKGFRFSFEAHPRPIMVELTSGSTLPVRRIKNGK